MADKTHHATTSRETKPAKHGAFKHVAEPATLAEVLHAYGMTEKSFREVKKYVSGRLEKKPAHAR